MLAFHLSQAKFMNTIRRPALIACLAWFGTLLLGAPLHPLIGQTTTTTNTQDQIEPLIRQLGSSKFADRQKAFQVLGTGGIDVIEPLNQAIRQGDPEIQMRAIAVLGQLAVSGDRACQTKAQNSLARLSESEDLIVRQLVLAEMRQLGEALQNRAIDQLREQGAEIKINQFSSRLNSSRSFDILIGPNFRGILDQIGMLAWLDGQVKLTLIGENITDPVIERVSAIPGLYWLVIKRGEITNRSVEILKKVKTIRYLHLYYVSIDDDSAPSLADMKTLVQLRLFGTRISRQKSAWTQKALANTDVDWRNGAFLGIYFNDTEGPCVVSDVVKASAADVAGFRIGDRVNWFAEKKIATGREFLGSVADYMPGDRVKCGITRQGKAMELEFVLGRFPDIETMK